MKGARSIMGRMNLKSLGALLSVALMILLLASFASAGVIFQDDFNDGNAAGWTNSGGTPWWSVPSTSVVGNEFAWNGLGESTADALNGKTDMDITVDVPNPGMSEAIVLRYINGNNYVLAFLNGWFNYITIFEAVAGGYTFVTHVDTPGLTGAFSMHARVVGANLTFDVTNGTDSYSTSAVLPTALLGPGKFGLWGDSGSSGTHNPDGILHFDNFIASDPGLGTVAGRVTDSDIGTPIVGARVRLIAGGETVVTSAVTDDNGDYSIDAVANDYTVLACAAGHIQQTKPVTVVEVATATVDFSLAPTGDSTFYVKPDGSDLADGLTPATAWKSIDNGDKNALLLPGAMVNVMAGTYRYADPNPEVAYDYAVNLQNCPGAPGSPITYKAQGDVRVGMSTSFIEDRIFSIVAGHIVLDGFTLFGGCYGIYTESVEDLEVKNCVADGCYSLVYMAECVDSVVHNNVCLNTTQAIQCRNGNNCSINNNTIINNAFNGIGMWGVSTTGMVVKNNIIDGSTSVGGLSIMDLGDVVPTSLVDHTNNTFNNCYAAEKIGDVEYVSPIGTEEVVADPMFDPSGPYRLRYGSPCVDSGVNVGLPYLGAAPDRGAFEQLVLMSTSGTISGQVTDSATLVEIAGARVTVMVDGEPLTTLTDTGGNYSIKANPGQQNITTAATGYNYKTTPVVVPDSGSVSVNIALDPGGEYYVKPDGNDYADGLSPDGAWKSIDNGDKKGLLFPGDTVNVMAGNYSYLDPNPAAGYDYAVNLEKCYGEAGLPITYRAQGEVRVSMTPFQMEDKLFSIVAGHIVLDGFTFVGGCYAVYADFLEDLEIKNCVADGSYSLVYTAECFDSAVHNNLALNTIQAIQFRNCTNGKIINNTVVGNHFNAIGLFGVGTTGMVVKNNIIDGSAQIGGLTIFDLGNAVPTSLVDHTNNTFNNCLVAEKIGSVEHIAPIGTSEVIANPLYDPSNPYHLVYGSSCIDSGVNVGLAYSGAAPDRGAFEWAPISPFAAAKISDLLGKADGTDVLLNSTVVTSGSGIMSGTVIYVEDESRSAGIQVISRGDLPGVFEGNRITVYGRMTTLPNGKRALQALNILSVVTGQPALTPLGVTGKSVAGNGLDNVGLLVKVWGVVHRVAGTTSYFCVDDGSGKADGNGNAGIPVIASDLVSPILPSGFPADGSYVSVIGIADVEDVGGGFVSVIRPRSESDVR